MTTPKLPPLQWWGCARSPEDKLISLATEHSIKARERILLDRIEELEAAAAQDDSPADQPQLQRETGSHAVTDLAKAITTLRKERDDSATVGHQPIPWWMVDEFLAALDVQKPTAYVWIGSLQELRCLGYSPYVVLFSKPTGQAGIPLFAAPFRCTCHHGKGATP